MDCKVCGKELNEEWKSCPFCGAFIKKISEDSKTEEINTHSFEFEGVRRTGKFGFKYYNSTVEVAGDQIQADIHKEKNEKLTFSNSEIAEITYPLLPIMTAMDMFRIILFLILMIISKGLAIFAVVFFLKITIVRHMQIRLRSGNKISIPIRQKAETVEFLKAINWPQSAIQNVAVAAVGETALAIREWIISTLMLILAAVTLTAGLKMQAEDMNGTEKDFGVTKTSREDESVELSYDLYTDAENGLLYSNEDMQIVDKNGNVILEYSGYGITDNGYVYDKEGEHCLEGIMVDEERKLYVFIPGETSLEDSLQYVTWQESYQEYIDQYENYNCEYGLIYIDQDEIPELVIDYNLAEGGMEICSFDGEQVVSTYLPAKWIFYYPKENRLLSSGENEGCYESIIYLMAESYCVISEKYVLEDSTQVDRYGNVISYYYRNGKEIAYPEYEKALLEWHDSTEVYMENFYTMKEMLNNSVQ